MIENSFSPFGTLLKTIRRRQGLTQQSLASAIGLHRGTISRWEQGDYLPESKTMVLDLARCLRLDGQETRQLLEASLTALSPYWSVPLQRNPYFTGREEILEALHTHLGVEQAVALTQSSALQGLGGVGKTQIALEYAYQYALEYRAVFWIGAETSEQIVVGLQRIAEILQLPEREEKDQQRVIAAVQRWLISHSQWLLIWDNVEDLSLLDHFLPSARQGAVLLTTRLQVLGTAARGLDLKPLKQEEGVLFLLRRAKILEPEVCLDQLPLFAQRMPSLYEAATVLVTVLGGLPLALDQAGAFIEATQCGLPAYLELFCTKRAALLQLRGAGARQHPESVSTTLQLSIIATTEHHPAVMELLEVCALLQPDAIPEELFRKAGEHLGETLAAARDDALEWEQVVASACTYSLLSRHPEEQTLSMHRLTQAVLLDTMQETKQKRWTKLAIGALEALFPRALPNAELANWKQCERLLPHVLMCLHRAEAAEGSLTFASLTYKAAQYLHERGRYTEAEPLYRRALHIREQALGPDHPDVASSLHYLSALLGERGKYTEAEPLYRRALCIREQALGPDHPDVASSLNNLAILYYQQGKYAEAEPLYQRALCIREQALGPDHPFVATSLNNLAILLGEQGKYAEAEPLFQRALHIWGQALGPDHPRVAYPLIGLASLLGEQGKYAEAEPLFQRALTIREQHLGPDHPKVAYPLVGLAILFREQGKYAEAEPLYQRALRIREQALGLDHPQVAYPLIGLANLSREQGKYAEAEPLYRRALTIREQHLGSHHPETAETLHNLALLRQKQGNLSDAITLAERASSIRSLSLGDTHPETVAAQVLSARLVQEQAVAEKTTIEQDGEAMTGRGSDVSFSANDPLQGFLDACCELHPRAWCRISELWHAYEEWTASVQKRVPLSRRAFATQLKAFDCHPDRTNKARIWRGIRLAEKNR